MNNLCLKVDQRETKCKELLSDCEVKLELLEFADFQILNNDKILYLFERKTISDLLASIKDGRYKNQKANITANFKPFQYFYIIEGNVKYNSNPSNQNDKVVLSAVINTIIRDKMGIFFTKSEQETSELIKCIYNRIKNKPDEYTCEPQVCETVITTACKKKKSVSEVWKYQLCQIPDISEKTADAVIEKYRNLKYFYTVFRDKNKDEVITELSKIKTVDAKGKGRKLSDKQVLNLYTYLLHDNETNDSELDIEPENNSIKCEIKEENNDI
jgi:ERCC4-type nuclease